MLEINPNYLKKLFVVDNFYSDPHSVRRFALSVNYAADLRYYKGIRSTEAYHPDNIKEVFENIMGEKITNFPTNSPNGCFQITTSSDPQVYHHDLQKWAAMIYLTPDAPYETGTGTFACRGTKIHHNSHPDIMYAFRNCSDGGQNLDKTLFEPVDQIGNVYNRLVIFNAGYLHAALGYFGYKPENSRLWQMFFFD